MGYTVNDPMPTRDVANDAPGFQTGAAARIGAVTDVAPDNAQTDPTTLNGLLRFLAKAVDAVNGYQKVRLYNTANEIIQPPTPGPVASASSQSVTGALNEVTVSPALTLSAYAGGAMTANAVIAATELFPGVVKADNAKGVAYSLVLIDKADQKAALTVVFLKANVSWGAENSAPSPSDADAVNVLGIVPIATTDYIDSGGVSTATIRVGGLGFGIDPVAGTDDIYVAVVNGSGTPTYAADSLVLRLTTV